MGSTPSDAVKKLMHADFWYFVQIALICPNFEKSMRIVSFIQSFVLCLLFSVHIPSFVLAIASFAEEPGLFIQTTHFALIILIAFSIFCNHIKCRSIFIELYQIYDEFSTTLGPRTRKWLEDTKKDYNKINLAALIAPPLLVLFIMPGMLSSPRIDEMFGSEKLTGVKGGVNLDLPIKMWYPFDTSNTAEFLMVFFGQMVLVGTTGLLVVSGDFVFVNISIKLIQMIWALRLYIDNIEEIALEKMSKEGNKPQKLKYWDAYEECLKEVVFQHTKILRYNKCFIGVNAQVTATAFLAGGFSMAASLTEIIFGGERIGTSVLNLLLCTCELLYVVIICSYGQHIYDLSEYLHEAIYKTKWPHSPIKIQKIKAIILTRTVEPVKLSCLFWPINFETLSNVINYSYSYFNLLSASRSLA